MHSHPDESGYPGVSMRVGFGVTILARGLQGNGIDGIGSYTKEMLARLSSACHVSPYTFGEFGHVGLPGSTPARSLGSYPAQAAFSVATGIPFPLTSGLRKKIDLFHAPDHLIPNLGSTPIVATLMDAIPLSNPEWVAYRSRRIKSFAWKRVARWADTIITISEYSKQEIALHFDIQPERIHVIPLGVDAKWMQPANEALVAATLARLGIPRSFFLFVGTLQPRKNVERILEAHRSLPAGIRQEFPLIIVGRAGWQCEKLVEDLSSQAPGTHIRWLHYLPEADLLAVTKAATAVVFPSLGEGFGLPVLEAFASGAPVITSSTTSLPEVAGNAAILVDPRDASKIASAMQTLVEDEPLRQDLIQRGKSRALDYTWDKTVAMTLAVYRDLL